jgi:hypothetical protein
MRVIGSRALKGIFSRKKMGQNFGSLWRNIKTIVSQAADESLGKYKAFTQNKKLKI